MEYNLLLADSKVKPHQVTTLHLVSSFAFIGAGAIITIYNYTIPIWGLAILLAGLSLLGLTIFRNSWINDKKINPILRVVELIIATAFAIYSLLMQWKFPIVIFGGLSAALLFALFWERNAGGKLYIYVDDDGLRLPVVRRRFIPWNEVDIIVLKYGTLTINCLDNHLFQWSVSVPDVNLEAFDAFCSAKVEEHIGKRRNDEW